jgi:hypothetical protein
MRFFLVSTRGGGVDVGDPVPGRVRPGGRRRGGGQQGEDGRVDRSEMVKGPRRHVLYGAGPGYVSQGQ